MKKHIIDFLKSFYGIGTCVLLMIIVFTQVYRMKHPIILTDKQYGVSYNRFTGYTEIYMPGDTIYQTNYFKNYTVVPKIEKHNFE